MAVKCGNCGYVMETSQEIQSGALKLLDILFKTLDKIPPARLMAGTLNSTTGDTEPVKCPKCEAKGRWIDV